MRRALILLVLGWGCRHGSAEPADLRERARLASDGGHPVTALRLLREAVRREPGDSLSYAYLADLYRRHRWIGEGREFFARIAGRREAALPELGYYAAMFSVFAGDSADADRWLASASARRPPTRSEGLLIAEALRASGRGPAARALLAGTARRHPEDVEAAVRHALALAEGGDTSAAIAEIERALVIAPDSARVVGTAAELQYWRGDLDASERLTTRWLALDPGSAEGRWNLTRVALRRGELSRADSLLLLTTRTRR